MTDSFAGSFCYWKKTYPRRGYRDKEFNIISTEKNDFLCYDIMEKQVQIPAQQWL